MEVSGHLKENRTGVFMLVAGGAWGNVGGWVAHVFLCVSVMSGPEQGWRGVYSMWADEAADGR